MSIKKVTLASLILLSLTACSGGSGGSSDTSVKQVTQNQQTAQQKAQADKVAAEKEAKDKAEAERLAAEKEAAEKAEAERLVAEKANAERLEIRKDKLKEISDLAQKMGYSEAEANEYSLSVIDKVINDNFDYIYNMEQPYGLVYKFYDDAQELIHKAGLDTSDPEYHLVMGNLKITENDNFSTLNADIAKAVQAKFERLATEKAIAEKEEAERLAKAQKFEGLLNKAKEFGLTDEQAQDYANANIDSDEAVALENLNIKVIDIAKGITSADYKLGLQMVGSSQELDTRTICAPSCEPRNITTTIFNQLYNQKYSVVTADYTGQTGWVGYAGNRVDSSYIDVSAKGLKTELSAIPNEGKATYAGQAFNIAQEGSLIYTVDFNERSGAGIASGIFVGDVSLDKGDIIDGKISSTASLESNNSQIGSYSLEFFGPKAEEIGGKLSIENNLDYGLAGTRGEITK